MAAASEGNRRPQSALLGRDAIACERALVLAREASVTGSIDTAKVSELQQLQTLAMAPFGVQALSFLGGVPRLDLGR